MVRNIVGVLINIGIKKYNINLMKNILYAKNRNCAGITAPANGLYLVKVNYPFGW